MRQIVVFVNFLPNESLHVFILDPPSLLYAMTFSLLVKSSIHFKTGILILMTSVPTFEYGIPRCKCWYFHANIPWDWRGKGPTSSDSSINQKTKNAIVFIQVCIKITCNFPHFFCNTLPRQSCS